MRRVWRSVAVKRPWCARARAARARRGGASARAPPITRSQTMSPPEDALVSFAPLLLSLVLACSGWDNEALALLILCIGISFVGVSFLAARASAILMRYSLRRSASPGLGIGSCSPLLLLSAVAAVRMRMGVSIGPLRAHFWGLVGCAVQPSLALMLPRQLHHRPWLPLVIGHVVAQLVLAVARPAGFDALIAATCLAVHALALAGCVVGARGSFTLGEAAAIAQGLGLLAADTRLMSTCAWAAHLEVAAGLCVLRSSDDLATQALLSGGLALAAGLCAILAILSRARVRPIILSAVFVAVVGIALAAALLPWLTELVGSESLAWLLQSFTAPGRPMLIAYWAAATPLACIAAALVAPQPLAPGSPPPNRIHKARLLLARKLFHFLVVALFSPAIFAHLPLLQQAMAIVLVGFAMLEIIRLFALPPLAAPLTAFLSTFLDARDGGTLILTHTYLLFGCALPIWLSSALPAAQTQAPLATAALTAAPHAGVIVLGVGDAMASLVGVTLGRTCWPNSQKTLEGTGAGAGAMLALTALLLHAGSPDGLPAGAYTWTALGGCTALACLLEAVTDQIDNLFLPVGFLTSLLVAAAIDLA